MIHSLPVPYLIQERFVDGPLEGQYMHGVLQEYSEACLVNGFRIGSYQTSKFPEILRVTE